jgi:hypothetical protein
MYTRAPATTEAGDVPDRARLYPGITEPFLVTLRRLEGGDLKFIWWYVAEIDRDAVDGAVGRAEEGFDAEFWGFEEALERLTFEDDREVLKRALSLVELSPGFSGF